MDTDNKDSTAYLNETSNHNVGSFGYRLKQARMDKKISLEDASSELYILQRHLEAIESEDFKALPQQAFARGFVINYAKYLGLDAQQIAESFNRSYPDELKRNNIEDIESPLKPMGTLQREGKRSIRINPLLVLGLIGLIILAVFLIRTVSNAKDANDSDETTTDLVDDLTESEQSAGAAVNTAVVTDNNTFTSENSLENSGSAIETESTQVVDPNAAPSTLDFWVRNNTQIKVVDASGKTLLSGVQPRGGYKIKGQPPFQIQVEKVSNVSLNLDSEPVQLKEFAQNNQADFSLAP